MESPKTRRKANVSEAETEALIALVLRHERLLFGGGGGAARAAPGHKRQLWEHIRRQLSPLAACPRDVEDLKKRWRDLKRRDHARLRRLSEELRQGGTTPPLTLLPEDQREGATSSLSSDEEEVALPLPGAGLGTPPPAPCNGGFAEEPGLSSQSSFSEIKLKEEIVVKIVEPDEESSDTTVVPPSQEQFPLIETPYFGSFGKVKVKTSFQPHTEESNSFEQDSIHLQQQQIQVMQLGFESLNHNLRLLQHTVQDLSSSVGFMAHTLEAIKNVYVKNNAGPVTYLNSSTQTLAGYRSPESLAGGDRSRSQVVESSSRSSSCSSSSASQEPGSQDFTGTSLKNIKRENTNGDYYTMSDM